VTFVTIALYVASQRVFVVVVYLIIDSVRTRLDTLSYIRIRTDFSLSINQ
jgi:hypothetical protein